MEEILVEPRNYLQGTCYGCALCLHCNEDNTYSNCNCTNRSEKPKKTKKTSFFSRRFDPTKTRESQQLFLKVKDEIYGYNLDFSKKFSLSFCTKCNSAYDRQKSSNKQVGNVVSSISSPETVFIEEFKFKLIVKKKSSNLLPAKWVTIQEENFEDFLLSLEISVQDLLSNSSISNDEFNIAYKQLNSNGPGTHLEDENDFKEFINEYTNITNHKKSMAICITMREITLAKRRKENDRKVTHRFN
jgi:hypothetical protein